MFNLRISNPLLFVLLIGIHVTFQGRVYAMRWNLEGQFTGWTTEAEIHDTWENMSGLRYIPDMTLASDVNAHSILDAEFSLNCFAISGSGPYRDDMDLDLYRASLRYTTSQTETRIGLQKINFGPARLLRSLRWFDRLDPTDPLQLTEGVYGLRFRYDALNTANFWVWGLYGNGDTKGYEILPTPPSELEAGGRLQYPLFNGDVGLTFHSRPVDGSRYGIPEFRETRFALDGRWDIEIGLWFESVFQHQNSSLVPYEWTKRSTLGADYTFDIGSGLYVLIEHMGVGLSDKALGWKNDFHISAFSMNYPVGVMDRLTAIGYYYWNQEKYYQYLNLSRTYDRVTISIGLFYYPDMTGTDEGLFQDMIAGSKGGEIMIIFNH